MKKMIVIAALIGGMLMPAQMMANNNNDRKPKVENRGNRNEIRVSKDKKGGKKGDFKGGRNDYKKPGKPDYRPNRPCRPAPVVVVNRPAPRPCPPPPPRPCPPPPPRPKYYYNDYYYDNPIDDAAEAFVSIVALMSLIAD
jgi:hypothetical protein